MLQDDQLNGLNLYAYGLNNPIRYSDPTGRFVITGTVLLIAALIGFAAGAVVGGVYGGMTAAANGQNVWAGIGIGMLAGGLMGAGAGIAGVFIAPVLAGGSVVLGVGGATLGTGAALGIGAGIAFGSGFVVGMGQDLANQAVNKDPNEKLNWGAAAWSGFQWGVLNTVNAFNVGLGGPLANGASFALSLFFNFMYGAIGLLIDVLRGHKPKTNTNVQLNSSLKFNYAFGGY